MTDGITLRFDFFIAHAGPDAPLAEELNKSLAPHSKVFLDSRDLLAGDDWDHELASAQRSSLVTVVLVSSRSGVAYYQREEIAAAISMARKDKDSHRVVPVYVEETASSDVPYGLRIKHALSIARDGGPAGVAGELLNLLAKLRPAGAPALARTTPHASVSQLAQKLVYCSRCGEVIGHQSTCTGTNTYHAFMAGGANDYCGRCGARPGVPSTCTGTNTYHAFSRGSKSAYCSRCGAVPGVQSTCTGTNTYHAFVEGDARDA